MVISRLHWLQQKLSTFMLSVPVRIKVIGIGMLPVLILGFTLNYWITTSLADWLSYLLSDERVRAAMQAGSRSVTFVTILAALASTLLALLLTYLLTRPLIDLHHTAQEVAKGKLDSRVPVWANDEIGEVARSVNTMIDHLIASQEKLTQANQRLEAMNQVAMAAGRELDLPEVLDSILRGTLDLLGLDQGWVYLLDHDTGRFYLAHQHGLPDKLRVSLARYPTDEFCSCQKDLLSNHINANALLRTSCSRLDRLFTEKSYTHITVPLTARNQVFGVINLLCDKNFYPAVENLELITAIGAQASEIVANVWLHARLVEKEAARRLLLESLVRTQEDERYRLSRELHDGAGQIFTGLLVRLKILEKKVDPGELQEDISVVLKLVSSSIEQVRELSHRLRPAALEEFGLPVALENLVEDLFEETGIETNCACDLNQVVVPKETQTALYRIAQEALTNVLRHAEATKVGVELITTPISVCLRIEDDGRGFHVDIFPEYTNGMHLGLISMQERAEMIGGSLTVYSAPGEGTSLQVRIPLPAEMV